VKMNSGLVLRMLCCLAVFALYLYHIIHKQNTLNYLSLQIPKVTKDVKALEEENLRLQFAIDSFESPDHLMQLVKLEEHAHLRHPSLSEVLSLTQGLALHIEEAPAVKIFVPFKTQPVLAVGANH
jgi:hypothetical protein